MAIITDLPDDLVRQCLLRVPYISHRNLKAVCRRWNDLLSDPNFYSERKISGKSDQLLCFLTRNVEPFVNGITVFDPAEGTSERLPLDIPHCGGIPDSCKCVCVNGKLVLIGGFDRYYERETRNIFVYDFVFAKWSRGADIPNLRRFFAYAACSSTGRIYFAGGCDGKLNRLATAEAYDVEEDKWEVLPPMSEPRMDCWGICREGKFMVLGGAEDGSTEVFDPREGTWRRLENMWSLGGPATSYVPSFCSGQLYALHGRDIDWWWVMKYESVKNVWNAVASCPSPPLFQGVTQWHDWMVFYTEPSMCYLVHLVTGQNVAFRNMPKMSGKEYVQYVTTFEI